MSRLTFSPTRRQRRRQSGVVLILAIVVLVAMSLAALALMRSSLTGNRVAGNLAFQQAATQSADTGVESAVAWLEQNRLGSTLWNDVSRAGAGTKGYLSTRADPAAGQSWSDWWDALNSNYKNPVADDGSGNPTQDAAGNKTQFVIQRLCRDSGDPTLDTGCEKAPTTSCSGCSMTPGQHPAAASPAFYYRVTSRVQGARGTVSFVQVVVTM